MEPCETDVRRRTEIDDSALVSLKHSYRVESRIAVALAGYRLPQSLVSHETTSPECEYNAKHPLAIFARFLV